LLLAQSLRAAVTCHCECYFEA